MIKKLTLGVLSLIALNSNSQTSGAISNVAWKQFYSERNNIANVPSAIDAGSNVYQTGYTYSTPSNQDATTIKYDAVGTFQFSVSYDNGGTDNSKAIILDASGNFYITGESDGVGTGRDIFTAKYSSAGVLIWVKRFNGASNGNDLGSAITLDPSGNVYVTGYTTNMGGNRDYVTIGYSNSGTQLFAVTFAGAGNGNDEAVSLAFSNSRLFVTGTSVNASGNSDLVTLRLNPTTGATVWTKSENGTANSNDVAYALIADGNDVVAVGNVNNTTTGNDYITVKYNGNNGATLFNKTYDFANSNNIATALVKDATGNYAVTGISLNGAIYEYHTIMYNNSGTQQWINKVSTGLTYSSAMPQIAVDPIANHFYVCGQKQGVSSDIFVYQITPGGNKTWEELVNGAQNGQDAAVDLVVNSTGDLYVAGASLNSSAKFDYATIKINQTPVYFPIDFNNANEPFANNHYFYQNNNHFLTTSGATATNIAYYTKYTNPQQFILKNNNISFVMATQDTSIKLTGNDTMHRVDLEFIKGNTNTRPYSFNEQNNGVLNYFLNHINTSPITDVKGSTRLMIPNIYPNIDLHYYSNSSGLKMYFVVKPGGTPNDILMNFNGATSTAINGSNGLNINTSLGSFKFAKPQVYTVNTLMMTTAATGTVGWNNVSGNTYKLNTGSYNNTLPLVIQINQGAASTSSVQNLKWSTFYGGITGDKIYNSKSDASNNLFVCGTTNSNNFPQAIGQSVVQSSVSPGSSDGFLAKFKPSGELEWSTYLGASNYDRFFGLDFNGGDVYLVGSTTSSNMPTQAKSGAYNNSTFIGPLNFMNITSNNFEDAFIFQINASNGNQNKWLTYYNGDRFDFLFSCKFDAAGNFFVVGASTSANIPVFASGAQYAQTYGAPVYQQANSIRDGIIAKFTASTSALSWATYYGTTASSTNKLPEDEFLDLDFDASSNVYVVGKSGGNAIPGKINNEFTTSNTDGIIVKFANNGQLLSSKYTQKNEINNAVRINNNKAYMVGYSSSTLVAVNSGLYYFNNVNNLGGSPLNYEGSLIITDLNLNTVHTTLLGGKNNDEIKSIEFDPTGIFYLSGGTDSNNFPTQTPVNTYSSSFNTTGNNDYFITAMKEGYTNLLWSTYLGSSATDSDFGNSASIAIDGNNNLHISGVTSSNTNFPVDNGGGPPTYFQPTYGGGYWDGTITRFNLASVQIVGVKENVISNNGLSIYPNPTNDRLYFKDEVDNKILSYKIYNTMGQLVLSNNTINNVNEINVSHLTSGTYILQFTAKNNTFVNKFIKTQ